MKHSLKHIILSLAIMNFLEARSQVAMPDTVCIGTTHLYQVNDTTVNSFYTWKINDLTQSATGNSITVKWATPGTFLVTVVEHGAGGCDGEMRSGYVYVNAPPVPNAGPDAVVCFGTPGQLNGSGGTVYHWSPSLNLSNPDIPNPVINTHNAGTFIYTLSVRDAGGCAPLKKDTVVIRILPEAKIFAGKDTSVVMSQTLQLNAEDINNSGFVSYSWSPSFGLNNPFIKNPVASPGSDTRYEVTARTSEGCEAKDDISIKVFSESGFYVPSAFTPNGDGLNDVLKLIPIGIKELKYFNIYNRWGELVFTTKDTSKGWDGHYNGKSQGNFVFVWEAEAVGFNGEVIKKKGTVALIR